VLNEEATNTNFKVFGSNRPGLEHTIYRTLGERAIHYATNVVFKNEITEHAMTFYFEPVLV
jgi:hypothetical protein